MRIEYSSVNHRWVRSAVIVLGDLNALCFGAHPWYERWSLSEREKDPRVGTYAAMRSFIEADGDYFVGTANGKAGGRHVAAFAAGLTLNETNLEIHNVSRFGARAGDYYQAVVLVHPAVERNGAFRELSERRLARAESRNPENIWVVTHPEQKRVLTFYQSRGFEISAEYVTTVTGMESPRVVLRRKR